MISIAILALIIGVTIPVTLFITSLWGWAFNHERWVKETQGWSRKGRVKIFFALGLGTILGHGFLRYMARRERRKA